jgi:phosphoglycerate dehydrogenase-like enzyme
MGLRIAIVNSSSFGRRFPEHIERLERLGQVERVRVAGDCHGEELAEALAPFDVAISSVTPFFDAEFFERKRDLRLIARHGIGYNNVDVEAAAACGCVVTIVSAEIERDAVAEGSVALLMDVMRHVSDSRVAASEGRWADRAQFVGAGLSHKVAGIIGCGNIGSRVAEILGGGFDMEVLACDPVRRDEWAGAHGVSYVSLDELLERADVVSMNASLNETSVGLLGASAFARMRRGAYVVNCARADLVDQDAMLAALDEGVVAGYATDVMHDEPPAADHPYLHHPKVLATTHISAYTVECLKGMGDKCVADVERLVAGEAPVNAVTPA